jgi:hypothetical protein
MQFAVSSLSAVSTGAVSKSNARTTEELKLNESRVQGRTSVPAFRCRSMTRVTKKSTCQNKRMDGAVTHE